MFEKKTSLRRLSVWGGFVFVLASLFSTTGCVVTINIQPQPGDTAQLPVDPNAPDPTTLDPGAPAPTDPTADPSADPGAPAADPSADPGAPTTDPAANPTDPPTDPSSGDDGAVVTDGNTGDDNGDTDNPLGPGNTGDTPPPAPGDGTDLTDPVDGDFQPATPGKVDIKLGTYSGSPGQVVTATVSMNATQPVQSGSVTYTYDPKVVWVVASRTGSLLGDARWRIDQTTPGITILTFTDETGAISGEGPILEVDFRVDGAAGQTSDLAFTTAQINSVAGAAAPAVTLTAGQFTVQ